MKTRAVLMFLLTAHSVLEGARAQRPPENSALDRFIKESNAAGHDGPDSAGTSGSLFSPAATLADLASDLRARRVNDVLTIIVFDRASAVAKGVTKSARTSSAKASVNALAGKPPGGARLTNLLDLSSAQSLDGQGETSRETTLNTTLTARVTQVLPNGLLVVEGFKSVRVNSEVQQIGVRGVVRPVDVSPGNRVASDSLAYLELNVNGKGVVGDAIRRPNFLYRLLLGLMPF